jgi:ATP-dependent RNA helicase DDX31/DBP7
MPVDQPLKKVEIKLVDFSELAMNSRIQSSLV